MENKEEKEMPKNSNPNIIKIILIIILVGALCFACYYVGANDLLNIKKEEVPAKDEKEEDKEDEGEDETPISITQNEVNNLIDNLAKTDRCPSLERFVSSTKMTTNDVSNLTAYLLIERNVYLNNVTSFTLDEFTDQLKKYLGKNYNFDPTSINYYDGSCPQYNYNPETKTFSKQETGCGGSCGPTRYQVGTYTTTNDTISVNVMSDEKNYLLEFKQEDGNYIFSSSQPN